MPPWDVPVLNFAKSLRRELQERSLHTLPDFPL